MNGNLLDLNIDLTIDQRELWGIIILDENNAHLPSFPVLFFHPIQRYLHIPADHIYYTVVILSQKHRIFDGIGRIDFDGLIDQIQNESHGLNGAFFTGHKGFSTIRKHGFHLRRRDELLMAKNPLSIGDHIISHGENYGRTLYLFSFSRGILYFDAIIP